MELALALTGALAAGGLLVAWVGYDRRVILWLGLLAPFFPIAYIDRYYFDLPSAVKWLPFFGVAFAGAVGYLRSPRRGRVVAPELLVVYGAVLAVNLVSMVVNGIPIQAGMTESVKNGKLVMLRPPKVTTGATARNCPINFV